MRRPGAEGGSHHRLIAGILLAAGLSRRFGRQKLLEVWQGEPLVRRAARAWVEAEMDEVVVVISGDKSMRAAVSDLPITLLENAMPERGISRSVALGLGAVHGSAEAALIGVADQPFLTADALGQLIRAFQPGRIVVASYQDHRGSPAIFDRRFFPELLALDGDRGGQVVIDKHPGDVIDVDLPPEMGRDIDRPAEWPA